MAQGPKNTQKFKIHLNAFSGGETLDYKYGIQNAFYKSQALDFRKRASQMSVLPGARNLVNNLKDLPTVMEQDPAGKRYVLGDQGYLYRIDTSNNVSMVGNIGTNGAAGLTYNQQSDTLYAMGQQTASTYGKVQGTPSLGIGQFAQSVSTAPGVTTLYNSTDAAYDGAARSSATNTYTVPTTLSEGTGNFCYFAPDIEPFYSIKVYVVTKGTGDWTLTLHDSSNNLLEAVTVTTGNLTSGALNEFKFSTAGGIRALIKAVATGNSATYHFHLTSTVADGTAQVVNAGDLTGCNFQLYAYRFLKTNNGWHPSINFQGMLCVGNGQYLSTYDYTNDAAPNNQQWQRHRLLLDFGYEVCGLTINNQFLVIAAEKRSSSTTKNFQDGRLYFWDGTNSAPNIIIDIPMGAPYGATTVNNVTYFICAGALYAWGGGQQIIKVRTMAYQNTDYFNAVDNTIVNPNMMDSKYGLLLIGYPSVTTSTTLNYGIYTWGSVELLYPNSFGYSFTLANGTQNWTSANNLQMGMVKNFVDTTYVSWRSTTSGTTTYGMDIIDNFSTPASIFNFQSLIYDGGVVYKSKQAHRLKIKFEALPSGTTLQPGYSVNRGAWTYSSSASAGDTSIVLELNQLRFHELQWGFKGTCSSSASAPVIIGVTMEVDPLLEEVDLRKDS